MRKYLWAAAGGLVCLVLLGIGIEIGSATEDKPYYQCAQSGGYNPITIVSCAVVWLMRHIEPMGIVVTASATGVVALFTRTLSDATSKLWDATKAASKAAEDTAASALVSTRAHVWMRDMQIILERTNPDTFKVMGKYFISNGGQTPGFAKKIQIHLFRDAPDKWPSEPYYKGVKAEASGIFGPGENQGTGFEHRVSLTNADITDVMGDRRHLIFYGFIEYADVFRQEEVHFSGFAYKMVLPEVGVEQHHEIRSIGTLPAGPQIYWRYS